MRIHLMPLLILLSACSQVAIDGLFSFTGFFLQTASSLAAPIEWTNVPGSETTNRVSLSNGSEPAFFRLHQ